MAKKNTARKKVLFICTGNTCRSPMAEVIFKDMLSNRELTHRIAVESAGLMAAPGQPASEKAIEVSRENGLDLSTHRSSQASKNRLLEADLIVVMQKAHLEFLEQNLKPAVRDIKLLSDFSTGPLAGSDILDPFGGDKELYKRTFHQIKEGLNGLLANIMKD